MQIVIYNFRYLPERLTKHCLPQACIADGSSKSNAEEAGLMVFRTPLAAFDALLVLRPEALPQVSTSQAAITLLK